MEKVRYINFILVKDEFSKLIFRFLPQLSSCHSFYDTPPKSWAEVYKVYYAYEIVEQWIEDDEHREDLLFSTTFDECSIIDRVANFIENFEEWSFDHETFTPIGDGVQWKVRKDSFKNQQGFAFELWKHCGMGYRMFLPEEKCIAFAKFINDCCEYMLAHGEPI